LLYGGTFDPVHNGHLAIARVARDVLDCQVHLMPAADPPHRSAPGADAQARVRMLELALGNEPGLCVDRRELARAGTSYTVETLRQVRAEVGTQQPVALLLGADSFLSLPQWREWRELFALAHLVIAERPQSQLDVDMPEALRRVLTGRWVLNAAALQMAPCGHVLRLNQPLFPVSASDIRQRLADKAQWEELLPAAVAGYIREHRLYLQRYDLSTY